MRRDRDTALARLREPAAALWGPGARVTLVADARAAVEGAAALILITEWREFRSPEFTAIRAAMREPVLIDGRNLYEPELVAQSGFEYAGIGRPSTLRSWQSQALAA